jgi:Tfp pilus assembly protein PilF
MKAFMAYSDALHYDQNNIPVLNNYAYFLSLTGRGLDKALSMSQRAVALDSGNFTYIDTYAWILHLLGRDVEAKQQMQRALSLGGQLDGDILAHYGDILWALGEKFMAETYWKKAVDRGYDKADMERHINDIKSKE